MFGIYVIKKYWVIIWGVLDLFCDCFNSFFIVFICFLSNDINRFIIDIKDGIYDNIVIIIVMIMGCISCNEWFSILEF